MKAQKQCCYQTVTPVLWPVIDARTRCSNIPLPYKEERVSCMLEYPARCGKKVYGMLEYWRLTT